MKELGNFIKSCLTELFPKRNYKKRYWFWLDDPHAHYAPVKNKKDLEMLLKNITSKLGRTAITDWGKNVNNVLKYNDFVKAIEDYSKINKDCSIQNKGVVSIISYKGKITEIYPSQEIRTKSHLHITAEGCEDLIEEGLDPRKTIEIIHSYGGLALVEHPTTKNHPIKQYTSTNEKEDKLTLEVFEMADAAEVFNSYNTLWMYKGNEKAKELVKKFNKGKIAAIAGSDSHFGLSDNLTKKLFYKNIGKTGIYLIKCNNSPLTGKEIIEQKREDLQKGNYEILENYTGPITFFMTMIPPIIARKLKLNPDSIS